MSSLRPPASASQLSESISSHILTRTLTPMHSHETRQVHILINTKTAHDPVLDTYCTCPAGARTIGGCGHAIAILQVVVIQIATRTKLMYFGVCSSFTIVNEATLLRQRARRSCSKTGRIFQILANYDVCFDKFGRCEFK